jgi:DNA repair protein RadD
VDAPEAEKPAADEARGLPETVQLGGQNCFVATLPFEKNQAAERALRPLWPHQERTLAELRTRMLAGCSRIVIQLPTGAGKTRLAAEIIKGALAKGKRVAFLVPRISLIDQTLVAFAAEGIDCVGILQADHPGFDPDQPVQIISAQTLARRKRPEVDLIITDEVHLLSKAALQWLKELGSAKAIGLSATPWARGLGKHYDGLIIGATINELIDAGHLSRFRAYAPSEPDLAGVRTLAGDFNEGELAERVNTTKLVGDILAEWLKRGEDRPTLCFGVNRAHAQHIQQRFEEAGVNCAYVDAFVDRSERKRVFEAFRRGEVKVISSVATIEVGVDLPTCSCIIDARPTKSRMAFVQRIGRGLRVSPGKTDCIILDHAGNHVRLGMVNEIAQSHLDDGGHAKDRKREAKERAEPLPKLCDECKAVVPPKAKECPGCDAPVLRRTSVEHEDGELIELSAHRSGKVEPSIAEKAIFHAQLRGFAADRGYRDGWVSHKFKEKFGVWPNDPRIRSGPALSPSLATRNWILSRNIAFTKGRRAHG